MGSVESFVREDNVFGNPITVEDGMGVPPEGQMRKARARAALDAKKADGKYDKALEYLRKLKHRWGNGVSTLCLVYNATGETLKFVTSHDWWGYINDEGQFPMEIANGQWGAFMHVKRTGTADGSNGAVVYRGKNEDGRDTDWMVAWDNPWNKSRYRNKAYAEIHEAGYFDTINWDIIYNAIPRANLQHRATWRGCAATVQTKSDTTVVFEAVLSFE